MQSGGAQVQWRTLPGVRPSPPTSRVPDPDASFWLMTILATVAGASCVNGLRIQLGLGSWMAGAILTICAIGLIVAERRTTKRSAWVYWAAIAIVGAVGALVTAAVTEPTGLPPEATAVVFAVSVAAVLLVWARSEGTLSPVAVGSDRGERFYWLTILFTSALGSALNLVFDDRLALGQGWSAIIFAAFLLATYAAYKGLLAGAVASFWLGYILVRPLSAAIAGALAAPNTAGIFGPVGVTVALLAAMILLLAGLRGGGPGKAGRPSAFLGGHDDTPSSPSSERSTPTR